MMRFEYDNEKSESNKAKLGLDFDEARALWDDQNLLVAPARYVNEPRFVAVGRIGHRHWTAIFTPRGRALRIISVRRAHKNEVDLYERK